MRLNAFTPNLMVDNVNQTVAYYTTLLGFELFMSSPTKGTFEWAFIKNGSTKLMFQTTTSLKAEFKELDAHQKGGALTFFVQVEAPKQLFDSIKDKVEIIKPYGVTTYNGAKEFVIRDPNGFILHFSDITFE